jgi:hypothetical protein
MTIVIATRFGNHGQMVPIMSPAFWGLLGAALAAGVSMSMKEHVQA